MLSVLSLEPLMSINTKLENWEFVFCVLSLPNTSKHNLTGAATNIHILSGDTIVFSGICIFLFQQKSMFVDGFILSEYVNNGFRFVLLLYRITLKRPEKCWKIVRTCFPPSECTSFFPGSTLRQPACYLSALYAEPAPHYELHVPPSSSFRAGDIIGNVSSHKHTSPEETHSRCTIPTARVLKEWLHSKAVLLKGIEPQLWVEAVCRAHPAGIMSMRHFADQSKWCRL